MAGKRSNIKPRLHLASTSLSAAFAVCALVAGGVEATMRYDIQNNAAAKVEVRDNGDVCYLFKKEDALSVEWSVVCDETWAHKNRPLIAGTSALMAVGLFGFSRRLKRETAVQNGKPNQPS